MKFLVEIGPGEGMRSSEDAAEALEGVVEKIRRGEPEGIVTDANGNEVGQYGWVDEARPGDRDILDFLFEWL